MFKRNAGRFNHKITLCKPNNLTRDELGGINEVAYTDVLTIFSMVEQRNQSRQQINNDYITSDTRYFVIRDISNLFNINTEWRIKYNNYTYIINDVLLIDESIPKFIQLTATAINTKGGII